MQSHPFRGLATAAAGSGDGGALGLRLLGCCGDGICMACICSRHEWSISWDVDGGVDSQVTHHSK